MISEFELLTEKVKQLTVLAHTLRSENARLRNDVVSLATQNTDLQQRMQQAHDRVSALLSQLPAEVLNDKEAA
ncbi:DUF904 domain-containing protein [Undibacterium sp. TC4M20W]|uniref:DUF904 domain-containing protein n=1 Tax=unclassified Undibacterium TaxID=2630295 RepID=UPI003BEFCE48